MLKTFLLLLALLLCCSCASIISESVYPVALCSSPAGAKYELKNKYGLTISAGRTPAVVSLDASNGFFSRAHYQFFCYSEDGKTVTQMPINASLDGWYVGNILFGGLIGCLIVDPATGAMWKLPETVYASLPADAVAPSPGAIPSPSLPVSPQ